MVKPTSKRKVLTIRDKYDVLSFHKANSTISTRKLAEKFQCGKTQIQLILKNRDMIIEEYESNIAIDRKRVTNLNLMDEKIYTWFCAAREKQIPMSGPILQEKANDVAKDVGLTDFKASNGWLEKWKKRHNIKQFNVSGESADVNPATVDSWKEVLRELLTDFELRDVYNMDETGLFFKSLPNKTLSEKGKECKGGKGSKLRITLALFCSATGEKEDPIVIGKSAKPRCFSDLKQTDKINGVHYFHDKKSWMQITTMKTLLHRFNKKMMQQKRKVLLLLDNAPVHPKELLGMYSNIKIAFLPANTTSKLQPLDAGIIQNVKVHYRKLLLRHIISRIDQDLPASNVANSVNILTAIYWIKRSWENVSNQCIANCFRKCGISQQDTIENDDPFDDLEELTSLISDLNSKLGSNDLALTAQEFVNIDSTIPEAIPETILETSPDDDVISVSEDEEPIELVSSISSTSEALKRSQELFNFFVSRGEDKLANQQLDLIQTIEKVKLEKLCKNSVQTKLSSFFK